MYLYFFKFIILYKYLLISLNLIFLLINKFTKLSFDATITVLNNVICFGINFKILVEGNEINIFFDSNNYNLIGWQTLDIYQNLSITYIYSLKINQILEKDFFRLPTSN